MLKGDVLGPQQICEMMLRGAGRMRYSGDRTREDYESDGLMKKTYSPRVVHGVLYLKCCDGLRLRSMPQESGLEANNENG